MGGIFEKIDCGLVASYNISLLITKSGTSNTSIDEEFSLPAIQEAVELLCIEICACDSVNSVE